MKKFQDISRAYANPINFDNVTKYFGKFKIHSDQLTYNYMRKKRPYRMKDHRKHSSIWYGHIVHQKVPILSIPLYLDGYIHSYNYFTVIKQLMGTPRLITKDIEQTEGMKDITH